MNEKANPHDLKKNEIMLGKKQLFSIPPDSKIQVIDIKMALLSKKFKKEDVDYAFREYDGDFPYIYAVLNAFKTNDEVAIIAKPEDVYRIKKIISIFKDAFNCKMPYGDDGELITDYKGKDRVKIIITKKL